MRAVDPAEGLLRPIEFWKKGGAGTERNPPHGCKVNSPRVKRSARPAMMANGPPDGETLFVPLSVAEYP